jgi:hypothetical protein
MESLFSTMIHSPFNFDAAQISIASCSLLIILESKCEEFEKAIYVDFYVSKYLEHICPKYLV